MAIKPYNRVKHYLYPELIEQVREVKKKYPSSKLKMSKKGQVICTIELQPTENSSVYIVSLKAKVGESWVNVFVDNPKLIYLKDGKLVPHIYPDKSLCLFYPDFSEWDYTDSWADTIVPWTCLWLYYYEIWIQTGEWLGGGIHGKVKQKNDVDN